MIDRSLQRLNRQPLNRLAKKALEEVKEWPDPEALYCLQLAKWAIESGKIGLNPKINLELQSVLETLLYRDSPKGAMRWLENNGEDDVLSHLDLKEMNNPIDLAAAIIDQIDSRATETIDGYAPPPYPRIPYA